jgi:hypothetical protein
MREVQHMDTPNPASLVVHDIALKDIVTMLPSGRPGYFKQLTFWVGDHGPFLKDWPVSEFDASVAKKYMEDQVQELRLITGAHAAP